MSKVAIHTHFTNNWEELASITIPNTQRYADKHGYDFHIEKYPDGNVDFVKTKTALKLLDEYDVVFCLEADMLITNHAVKVESFIDDKSAFYLCVDVNGVNGGSFIAVGENGGLVLKYTNDAPKTQHEYSLTTEQNVWEHISHIEAVLLKVKILHHPSINSIPYKYYHNYGYINYNGQPEPTHEQGNWQPSDFICHLPGKPLSERISIFNEIKQHIIYE